MALIRIAWLNLAGLSVLEIDCVGGVSEGKSKTESETMAHGLVAEQWGRYITFIMSLWFCKEEINPAESNSSWSNLLLLFMKPQFEKKNTVCKVGN